MFWNTNHNNKGVTATQMKQIPIPNTSSPEVRLMLQVQTSTNYVIHTVLHTSETGKHHSLKGAKPAAPGIQFHVHLKNPQKNNN